MSRVECEAFWRWSPAGRVSPTRGSVVDVSYREHPPPTHLRELVECRWAADGQGEQIRVLPDGCMDLIRVNGCVVVAGPDTTAFITPRGPEPCAGVRFRPGVLPRLLGVPASEVLNSRVPLDELTARAALVPDASLIDLATELTTTATTSETAPWPMPVLARVTRRLGSGAAVTDVAEDIGWSARTIQRHCVAIYGYGPATLRRLLRFRRAMRLLHSGVPHTEVAARAGYADQPHLHREVRNLAGVPLASVLSGYAANGANRSTPVPSGSATVA